MRNTKNTGEFYSPEKVATILNNIARKKKYQRIRVSGGEPTIGKKHLLSLLEKIDSDLIFIIERNGILLGLNKEYINSLSNFNNLQIRVCLKGVNPEEFSFLTGAKTGFNYQIRSLEYLRDSGISFNIAVVTIKDYKKEFYQKLNQMNLGNIMIEEEKIKLYTQVKNRLKKEGILDLFM